MPFVNNKTYLELAKVDFNNCQALHQIEWDSIQKWYLVCNLVDYGLSRKTLLFVYFIATASVFEPERSTERLAWAKTMALVEAITSYFEGEEMRRALLHEFKNNTSYVQTTNNERRSDSNKKAEELIRTLLETLNDLSLEAHCQEINNHLRLAWEKWLLKWHREGNRYQGEVELLLQMINITAGRLLSKEVLSHPQYERLSALVHRLHHQFSYYQKHKVYDNDSFNKNTDSMRTPEIESNMQEIVQLVLQKSSDDIDSDIKQTFLTIAKSFYYAAYCDPGTIDFHIIKVLFERVV